MSVEYAVDRGIATVTLDSPHNRNALSTALVRALIEHLTAADGDKEVRAVVLTHTGSTFCSGADLTEQTAEGGGPAGGPARMLALLRTVLELGKPVLARIDGHVRAGGMGLVGACDIAVAGPAATFAFTEVRLGLTPAVVSLTTLGRMSERAAARYCLTGETFDGAAAAAAGLVTAAVPDVDAEIAALSDALRRGSPQGLAETKALVTAAARARFDAGADAMHRLSQRLFESDEAQEAMRAFLADRRPRWSAER